MKYSSLIPELSVSDIEISKQFYVDILGFKIEYQREKDKFIFLSIGDAQIMLEEINGYWATGELRTPFGRGVNFQIAVDNVVTIANKLKDNGFTLFRDITENHYECNGSIIIEKEILVQDPDGYLLRFSQTL